MFPERIGRYPVSRLLGSGGFAAVWLAVDDALGGHVAIKVLADNWAHVPDIRSRFVEEARILRRADSDRVVRVYDIGELPGGQPYFVMAYADRGTVADRLNGPGLPVHEALHVAIEAARAVAVLHGIGIIHRDIKPSNVLIKTSPGGGEQILIADLGVAKPFAFASGFTIAAGTPGYMAPEQSVPGAHLDARADVYGLGALAYHLITGTKYDAEAGRHDLPKKLGAVVLRALHQDRERRWPDALSFADALAEVVPPEPVPVPPGGDHTVELSTVAIPVSGTAGRRWRPAVLAAAALVLVVGLVAGLLLWTGGRGGDAGSGAAGQPPGTSSTAASSTTPSVPPPPAAVKLEFGFAIDPVPGFRVGGSGIDGTTQWADVRTTAGAVATSVTVYAPGTYDPTEGRDGQPVEVAGRPGFYEVALPDPGTGSAPSNQTRKPAAVVQYAPDAWYVVQTDLEPAAARDAVLAIAGAVRFGAQRPLRYPIRLGYLPATLRPCGGLDGLDPGWNGPWNAWIDLCDDVRSSGVGDSAAAVRFHMIRDRTNVPDRNGPRINGLPTSIEDHGTTVDCGQFVLTIEIATSHQPKYSLELVKIIEGLTVRGFDDKSSWFAGSAAVPTVP